MVLYQLCSMLYCLLLLAATVASSLHELNERQQLHSSPSSLWSTNSWAVEIEGGLEKADAIAIRHGLLNLGQIGSLEDKYTFIKIDDTMQGSSLYRFYDTQKFTDVHTDLMDDSEIKYVIHQLPRMFSKKNIPSQTAQNPIWSDQWSLNNTGQTGENDILLDINVVPAWNLGYSGKGVLVGVVDDGVDGAHVDLEMNYDFSSSFNFVDNNSDANPSDSQDNHGTACAGEIAMILSNDKCGVGVAYDAHIAGLRINTYMMVDSQEASALSYNRSAIDIYSSSWGPPDTGYTVLGPGPILYSAFQEGSIKGRDGLGNIYTWAAGNGGNVLDSCAADGYVNSIYTIPVGAYNQIGGPAYYDEMCSAKMTVAYVDNTNNDELQVPTLDLDDKCTLNFDGTSSATPLVSGVISLALEANPQLTWRDVQYLIVYTSNSRVLLNNTDDYFTNGAGLTVSHSFGFGAIDAEAMVTRARQWETVPPQISNTVIPSMNSGESSFSKPFISNLNYSGDIRYLEHVIVSMILNVSNYEDLITPESADEIVDANLIEYKNNVDEVANVLAEVPKRGDLQITISSPSNTESTLLFRRPLDIVNSEGYHSQEIQGQVTPWPFLSVLHWGEDPRGQWTINVTWTNPNGGVGIVSNVSMTFYGVSRAPVIPSSSILLSGNILLVVFTILGIIAII